MKVREPQSTRFRPSAAAACGQHPGARPTGERLRESAADMGTGCAFLRDARQDVAVRSAAQQQRGESACATDPVDALRGFRGSFHADSPLFRVFRALRGCFFLSVTDLQPLDSQLTFNR